MKITVYKTHLEAECKLKPFFYDNAMAVVGCSRLLVNLVRDAEKIAPRSKEHLMQILGEGLPKIGVGQKITTPIRLYNSNSGYAIETNYFYMGSEGSSLWSGFFNSLEDLSDIIGDSITKLPFTYLGVKEKPFLYTVTEPHHLSRAEKLKVRKICDYKKLNPAGKNELNVMLKKYAEHGLNLKERQEVRKILTR